MVNSHKFSVIDGHIDTATKLHEQKRKFCERSTTGQFDLPRMEEGNVQVALFAIFPASTQKFIIKNLDTWLTMVWDPASGLMQVKSLNDFKKIENDGKKGAILHFEGSGGIDVDHQLLRISYHLGLRSMGLSWSNTNKFATGVKFSGKQSKTGLTDEGRKLLAECQSLGITIDVSHLNDPSFWDVIESTTKPIFATHSNARAITNHPRNLTDDQIKAIHEKHGTIGINFCSAFMNAENPGKDNIEIGFETIKDHMDHIVNLSDINTLAIGSDFDGATVPNCVKDCAKFPDLWEYLLNNGYSESDIEKISRSNLLRIFKDTWK